MDDNPAPRPVDSRVTFGQLAAGAAGAAGLAAAVAPGPATAALATGTALLQGFANHGSKLLHVAQAGKGIFDLARGNTSASDEEKRARAKAARLTAGLHNLAQAALGAVDRITKPPPGTHGLLRAHGTKYGAKGKVRGRKFKRSNLLGEAPAVDKVSSHYYRPVPLPPPGLTRRQLRQYFGEHAVALREAPPHRRVIHHRSGKNHHFVTRDVGGDMYARAKMYIPHDVKIPNTRYKVLPYLNGDNYHTRIQAKLLSRGLAKIMSGDEETYGKLLLAHERTPHNLFFQQTHRQPLGGAKVSTVYTSEAKRLLASGASQAFAAPVEPARRKRPVVAPVRHLMLENVASSKENKNAVDKIKPNMGSAPQTHPIPG